jgi:hypothetical protein
VVVVAAGSGSVHGGSDADGWWRGAAGGSGSGWW